MKGTRHSEEQIIAILKQSEAGLTTAELCRQQGITEQTYIAGRRSNGRESEAEATRWPTLSLDDRALKDVFSKNW
jgi:putative transposase